MTTDGQRKYPNLADLEKSAIVNKAWRVDHPDPNRCNACHETDYRMVKVRYRTTDTDDAKEIALAFYEGRYSDAQAVVRRMKLNGKNVIGHVEREHRVCNWCYPDPNQLTIQD